MTPEAVTFDCAETLVRVRWSPRRLALECVRALGLECDADRAAAEYEALAISRRDDFVRINLSRDHDLCDAFWDRLSADWLAWLGEPADRLGQMRSAADEVLYGARSAVFELYGDVLPVLDRLRTRGVRLGVVSNWDYSLHRVLRSKAIYDRFDVVVASLEEGFEKPDPRIFHLACERLGVPPERTAHVGDNPLDDYQGANAAGLQGVWLDRERSDPCGRIIPSLSFLPGVLGWTD